MDRHYVMARPRSTISSRSSRLIIYKNNDHTQEYIGQIKLIESSNMFTPSTEGNRHGIGTTYYISGATHTGNYKNNKMHGNGVLKIDNITTITGAWNDDVITTATKTIIHPLGYIIYEYKGAIDSNYIPHGNGIEKIEGFATHGEFNHGEFNHCEHIPKKVIKQKRKKEIDLLVTKK
jgi:hypothetical protein